MFQQSLTLSAFVDSLLHEILAICPNHMQCTQFKILLFSQFRYFSLYRCPFVFTCHKVICSVTHFLSRSVGQSVGWLVGPD